MTSSLQNLFLRGKQVSLRAIEEADLPRIVHWINDPEIRPMINRPFLLDMQAEIEWQKSRDRSRFPSDMAFAIILNEDGRHIGNMGVHGIDWVSRFATTGTVIGEKDEWGKGYAVEAKLLLLDYLFNTLNLNRVESSVLAINKRSLKYLEKCGYRREGTRKAKHFRNGAWIDEILLSITRKTWLKHQRT